MDFQKEARVQYGFFKIRLESNTRRMEEIPPAELNNLLRTFFIKVRRHDDNPYQPDSIKAKQNSFDRYLSEKGYDASLLRDHVFKGSRLVTDAKHKNLKHNGLGRKQYRAQFLTEDEEVSKIWVKKKENLPSKSLHTFFFHVSMCHVNFMFVLCLTLSQTSPGFYVSAVHAF